MKRAIRGRAASTRLLAGALAVLLAIAAASATEPETGTTEPTPSPDALLEEVRLLRELVESLATERDEEIERLRARIEQLEERLELERAKREEDELAQILEDAEDATVEQAAREAEAEEQRKVFVGRQRTLQALNPEISVLGDVSYDWTDNDVKDQFLLRGAEFGFQAPLDPHTRFKAFVAGHQAPAELEHEHDEEPNGDEEHHGHEHSDEIDVSVEEIYMEWVGLPTNARLQVGRFRQQFGTLNRWHMHALPSVDVPFALRNVFGHHGLVGVGVGIDWQLPGLWASSNTLTLEVVNADNDAAFAGSEFRDPSYLLRHTGFFDLGPDTYLEIGLNGVTGPNDEDGDLDTTVSSLDFNFVWEPVERARYRGIEVRGEYIHTRYDPDEVGARTIESDSYYAYVSWKLSRRWIVGVRYDNAELPWPDVELYDEQEFEEGLKERAWTPYLTMWQSEFVRLRLQYQHTSRDFAWAHGPDDDDRLWLQATFAAGPHKHDAY
jgi:hypothetical protein